MPERCFLASSRSLRWAFGTFVGRRGVGLTAACRIRSKRRSRASSRLRSCARCCCAMMTMTPSLVTRLPASRMRRTATSVGSDGEWRASKRSCTADDTLLTFCPPGPDARTKDSVSSDSSMEIVSVMRIIMTASGCQIFLRQYLAFFHRRLVERIDAEQMRGDDRLQHEMHHQLAEAFLIEPLDVDRPHRAAVPGERLGGRPAFGRDQIADRLAGEAGFAGELGKLAVNARALSAGADRDDGEELVARAGNEQLQLAVLIDRPERRERRSPLTILAEALGPKLHVPMGQPLQPVAIGEQDADRFALAFRERNRQRGAERWGHLRRRFFRKYRREGKATAFADRANIEAKHRGGQQADIGQRGITATDTRIVVKHRHAKFAEQIAQSVFLAGFGRLGDSQKEIGDAGL